MSRDVLVLLPLAALLLVALWLIATWLFTLGPLVSDFPPR